MTHRSPARLYRAYIAIVGAAAVVAAVGAFFALWAAETTSAAPNAAPTNAGEPSITGTTKVGQILRTTRGSWTGTEPIQYAFRWFRCDGPGATEASKRRRTTNAGNSVRYTIQPNTALPNYSTIAKIFGGYFQGSLQTPVDAAAAQWAIWEVLQDGVASPSFASGGVQIQDAANSAVAARAMEYLNNLGSLPAIEVIYATNATRQDQLFVTIPEVSGLALGAVGSALLLVRRRR